jgi:NADH-quinone oxidoreductase subunit N
MTLQQLLLMRHEWLLVAAALILLVFDIGTDEGRRARLIPAAAALMALVTVAGFLPASQGPLFGGMYITDPLRIAMKNILNVGVAIIFLQSGGWLGRPENRQRPVEFFLLMISSVIGLDYMISSGHFLMFYLGLELTTIPVAVLAAYRQTEEKSAEAGIKLILSSAFSSAILLFGISLLYGTAGSLYFGEVPVQGTLLHTMSFIFFFSGLAFKISAVPFHLWTADVYEGSPSNVTSYLSVVSKGSAVFILILTLFTVFRPLHQLWQPVIYAVAVLTMTVGNLFAIRQNNLRRYLAFSSIAQAGFIFLGIVGGTSLGMGSVIYFILVYVFSNLAAFGVVAAVEQASGKENISDLKGFYRTNPRLSLTMMLALFSLAGIPPVAGFFGKFFLFAAAAESGYYWLLFIAVTNAIISLYYYLLVVKAMFIEKSDNPIPAFRSDTAMKLSLAVCVAGIVLVGLYGKVFEVINRLSFGI